MDTTCVMSQTVDLGFDRADLEMYLSQCGYWGDAEKRRRHAYVLSPSAYTMSASQAANMERLAVATGAAVSELNQHLCACANVKHPPHYEAEMLRFASSASRGLLLPRDGELRIPPVFKVDIVQDRFGRFQIVEVDVYNPRGFGYAALLEESMSGVFGTRRFPGVEQLVRILHAHGAEDAPFYVLVSEHERYYETCFTILCNTLRRRGIDARMVRECELSNQATLFDGVLLAIPDTLRDTNLRERLVAQYRSGALRAVFPPVAYLGSKAYLPFLREQDGMSEFMPPTALVSKKHRQWSSICDSGSSSVLKAVVSSGMKGVYFSDLDPQEFGARLAQVSDIKHAAWILQQQVPQTSTPIVVFDEQGNRCVGDYYLRLVAYVTADGVLDVEVTGRPDRKVHGAPDCIQIPVVLS